jgi:hypothetical protein
MTIKKSISLLLCLTLFACSSTEQVSHHDLSGNDLTQNYAGYSFPHSQFTPINNGGIKKPLGSDHQLMMSLLNRPMTEDQAMMLAFAQERARYTHTFTNYANSGVVIKGAKVEDEISNRMGHVYAQLISKDINSVLISGTR